MKIVIDISEEEYNECKNRFNMIYQEGYLNFNLNTALVILVANGTPLPKGHGDLIDKEKLKENINGWYAFMKDICKQPYMTMKQEEIIGKIDMMTPIINADKGKEE